MDERLTRRAQPFVVLRHASVVRDPREGALGDPSPRKVLEIRTLRQFAQVHLVTFLEPLPCPHPQYLLRRWLRGAVYDLNLQAECPLRPLLASAPIACVYLKQTPDAILIRDLRAVNPGLDHQAFRVHQDVALPAPHLLAAVKAPLLSADAGSLHRLAVHDSSTGLRVSPELRPQAFTHRAVQPLPGAIQTPGSKVVEHRLPGRELARKHAPLAAGFQDVEDGIKDFARTVQPRTSTPFLGREVRLEQSPLFF